jgi:hypothetical protein
VRIRDHSSKRASEHFSSLTLGSFDGLVTDFNDQDVNGLPPQPT